MSTETRLDSLLRRWDEHRRRGEEVTPEQLCRDCPELLEPFRRGLAAVRLVDRVAGGSVPAATSEPAAGTATRVPNPEGTVAYHETLPDVEPQPGAEPVPGFRLVRLLGRGGFGSVWRADAPGGFPVAMKFVPLAGRVGTSELQSLAVLRHLRHPNVLTTFGAWRSGTYLIVVMELADRTLADRLRQAKDQGLPAIPGPEVLEYMRAAAKGVDYLNQPHPLVEGQDPVRIQHRDLKPANILLVGDGVKLADFGLARVLERTLVSHTGGLTPAYAAPEFFSGRTSCHSDQYSLAVTYCELRGGRVPFPGGCGEVILGHLEGTPDLSPLPEAERPVVARALAKNPDGRWPSCTAFVRALERATSGAKTVPVTGHKPGTLPRQAAPCRRSRLAGFVTLVGLVAVAALWQWPSIRGMLTRPDPPTPPEDKVAGSGPTPADGQTRRTVPQVTPGPVEPVGGTKEVVGGTAGGLRPGGQETVIQDRPMVTLPPAAEPVGERLRFAKHGGPVRCAAWVPNSTRVLSGDDNGDLWLWDTATGREEYRRTGHTRPDPDASAVQCLAVSADGRSALSGGDDKTVRMWDLGAGGERKVLRKKRKADGDTEFRVYAVGFLGDGRRAVSAGNGDYLIVWDLDAGEEAERIKTLPEVLSLAVSPDGRRVLIGGANGALRLRELTRDGSEARYDGHRDDVLAVAFFPDGRRFVSAGGGDGPNPGHGDFALRVWTVGDPTPRVLKGHAARVGCVAVSPDGRRILSGDAAGSLRLWDAEAGLELPGLEPPGDGDRGAVTCVLFSPDGREAVSGHTDGTLRVWGLPP